MFRQDRTNPSTAVSNWRGRHDTPKAWPSTGVSTWLNGGLFGAPVLTAFGGIITQYEDSGTTYRVHTFRGSGKFYVANGSADVDVRIFAGGGSGGGGVGAGAGWAGGGGGGAGEYHSAVVPVSAGTYAITIGVGGVPTGAGVTGTDGGNSTGFGFTLVGGGGGGHAAAGRNGGCGGGAGQNGPADSSFSGGTASGSYTGYAGGLSRNYTTNGGWYESGGGGGTGAVGEAGGTDGNAEGGDGGIGVTTLGVTATTVKYASGGGGSGQGQGGTYPVDAYGGGS